MRVTGLKKRRSPILQRSITIKIRAIISHKSGSCVHGKRGKRTFSINVMVKKTAADRKISFLRER
jgi:hypothetical protein